MTIPKMLEASELPLIFKIGCVTITLRRVYSIYVDEVKSMRTESKFRRKKLIVDAEKLQELARLVGPASQRQFATRLIGCSQRRRSEPRFGSCMPLAASMTSFIRWMRRNQSGVRPQVLDTTAMIQLVRHPEGWSRFEAALIDKRLYLSSVGMSELYAGTRSRDESVILDRILRTANRIDQILTPSDEEWVTAGRLIARRIRLYGHFEARDHLADVLIVVSTARLSGEVVSANARHMTGWIDLAQRTGLDVTLGT